MDTGKTYYDEEGIECSIREMVRRYPDWAANRVQEGERAIASVEHLRAENAALVELVTVIEKRLREDTRPLVDLVNRHGGEAERKAWKAVYSSCIRAQVMARAESAEGE